MPTVTVDIFETTNHGLEYSGPAETWTIDTGVLVASQEMDGVVSEQDGSTLINNGYIFGGNIGARFDNPNATITNNAGYSIVGLVAGIVANDANATIFNHGLVSGSSQFGIFASNGATNFALTNSGEVYGRQGGVAIASTVDGGTINNSGFIHSGIDGVLIATANGLATVIGNAAGGTIAGNVTAIHTLDTGGRIALTNNGKIDGDILLEASSGNVNDSIVNRGKIIGEVHLGDGADLFNGNAGKFPVVVFGEEANDKLIGGKGNDKLDGGAGADVLTGGRGKDLLFGGADRDLFDFNSIKDSVRGGKRDKILDFQRGTDDIDLKGIDAHKGVSGNQKFKWIGKQDFHDKKGELRYEDKGSKVIVQGDVNGDGKADFEIWVGVGALSKGDFLL
ncbi:MAG: calcium-binding protein [Methyloceanibacter sp.]|uniref:calcium-binding protein n=1 Tax=Methyloceanibacter sp. TaxID=1965321 RepID=UPI003D6C91B5